MEMCTGMAGENWPTSTWNLLKSEGRKLLATKNPQGAGEITLWLPSVFKWQVSVAAHVLFQISEGRGRPSPAGTGQLGKL